MLRGSTIVWIDVRTATMLLVAFAKVSLLFHAILFIVPPVDDHTYTFSFCEGFLHLNEFSRFVPNIDDVTR